MDNGGLQLWRIFRYCMVLIVAQSNQVNAEEAYSFSGNIEFTTDYVFRGESETVDGEVPAVKSSITWSHNSGWYAGLFGANNKFESAPEITTVIGPYVGKSGKFYGGALKYNIFLFHYSYPNATQYNYSELWVEVSKSIGRWDHKVEITPTLSDWFGVDDWQGVNYAFHPTFNLSKRTKISGTVGHQALSGPNAEGWTHWNIGVTYPVNRLQFDLRYHDTDITSEHLVYGSPSGLKIFEERVVFSLSMKL